MESYRQGASRLRKDFYDFGRYMCIAVVAVWINHNLFFNIENGDNKTFFKTLVTSTKCDVEGEMVERRLLPSGGDHQRCDPCGEELLGCSAAPFVAADWAGPKAAHVIKVLWWSRWRIHSRGMTATEGGASFCARLLF